jgi:hypothetical protein
MQDKKRGNKRIKWSEINIEKDKYFLSLFPVSSLPNTPEARLEYINNLVDTGKISNDDAIELMDMPDLESYLSKKLAIKNSIDCAIDRMIESGVPEQLDALDNPELAYQIAHMCYLEMKANDCDPQTLNVLRTYIASCEAYLAAMQQQMQQSQAMQTPAPQVMQQGQAPTNVSMNVPY